MSLYRIYQSPFPSLLVPIDLSISQFLIQHNPDDVPLDKPILTDFDNVKNVITFDGLRKNAALGAAGLRAVLGLSEGDVISILGQNSVNWALLAHSVLWGGACFSAINPLATSYELVHYFTIAQPKIVAVDVSLLGIAQVALRASNLSPVPQLLLIDDESTGMHNGIKVFPQDIITANGAPVPPYDLTSRNNKKIPAGMCFSSGTSGKPKAVILTHHNLIAHLLTIRATNPFTHNGHMQEVFFPSFAHIYGIVSAVLLSAFVGSHVVAMKRFEFIPYLQRCAEIKATILRLVPATAIRMVKDPAVVALNLDLSNVKFVMCSGAALSPDVVEGLQNMLHPAASVLNGYGMTETTIALLRETWDQKKAGSVGRPAADVSIRIVDDDYNDVAPGSNGECLVKSPTVFLEYKNNPAETAATFQDGWMCTGDVVKMDEDGFLWLTGRKKELIKYKGNQVSPTELEAVLLEHPLVVDAGVCGVLDGNGDEVPLAFVSLVEQSEGQGIDQVLEEVRAFLEKRVAPYKRLRGGLQYLETLPKGNTGKLLRRELVAIHASRKLAKPKL